MKNTKLTWDNIRSLYPQLISAVKILLIVIALDFIAAISLSFFITDAFYFKKFIADEIHQEIMSDYYSNRYYIQPNVETGWINSPNFRDENTYTDSLGSRISTQFKGEHLSQEMLKGKVRSTFLLGSSVVQGFVLKHEETLAGHLNKIGHNALNFGAVGYSVDQSFALYKNILLQYKPKTLIVGIDRDADSISNMFIGFRGLDGERGLPLLKPAYHLSNNNKLSKTMPPAEHQYRREFSKMLLDLEKHDPFFYKFEYYKRLSLLPFSDSLRKVILRLDRKLYNVEEYIKAVELQKHIMMEMVKLARENGTQVIFIKLPAIYDFKQSFYNRMFDKYLHKNKNTIHTQLLKKTSMNIVYASEILKETGKPFSEFYIENDPIHLTDEAFGLIAKNISQKIH